VEKQSILVVDDSDDMLSLQKTILEGAGYEVFTARSGGAAYKVLCEIEDPNLIILDLQMDDMSGTDFLDMLEERKPEIIEHVPVVFLSGTETPPPSKAVGHIRKFPDIDAFLERVRGSSRRFRRKT
jgi:two-component system, OmpR family, response regulator CpxR